MLGCTALTCTRSLRRVHESHSKQQTADGKEMTESAMVLGVWLASDHAKIATADRDSLSVLVLNAHSLKEVVDLVSPLSKKLKGGVTVYAAGFTDKPGDAPQKMRFKKLEDGEWDVVILAPHATETMGAKALRIEVMTAFTVVKLTDKSRVIISAPSMAETNPVALRVRIFGHSPPTPEELKGSVSEEEVFQVLESLGFAEPYTQRLDCRMDISKFTKGLPGGLKEMSEWLRVAVENLKGLGPQQQVQLRKLCEKGTDEILTPLTVFSLPIPSGFEGDARAQPSFKDWWPQGNLTVFQNYGLDKWNEIRRKWETEGFSGNDQPKRTVTKVPKLTARELNSLVETLTTNHDRIELPHPMRLDDLLDVLVDVWDSLDDGA